MATPCEFLRCRAPRRKGALQNSQKMQTPKQKKQRCHGCCVCVCLCVGGEVGSGADAVRNHHSQAGTNEFVCKPQTFQVLCFMLYANDLAQKQRGMEEEKTVTEMRATHKKGSAATFCKISAGGQGKVFFFGTY